MPANLAEAVRRRKPGMSGGNVDLSTLEMDFGTVGEEDEIRFSLLLVHNPNPVPVLVTDLVALEDGLDFAYLAQYNQDDAPFAPNMPVDSRNRCLRTKTEGDPRVLSSENRGPSQTGIGCKEGQCVQLGQTYNISMQESHGAMALAAMYQASDAEVLALQAGVNNDANDWWSAVDNMTLDRCRQARGEWSWTCDMHARKRQLQKEGGDREQKGEASTSAPTENKYGMNIHDEPLLEHALHRAGLDQFCAGGHDQFDKNYVSLKRLEWTTSARAANVWRNRVVSSRSVAYLVVRLRRTKARKLEPSLLLPDKMRLTTAVMQQVSIAVRYQNSISMKVSSKLGELPSLDTPSNQSNTNKSKRHLDNSFFLGQPALTSYKDDYSNEESQGGKMHYKLNVYDQRADVMLPLFVKLSPDMGGVHMSQLSDMPYPLLALQGSQPPAMSLIVWV